MSNETQEKSEGKATRPRGALTWLMFAVAAVAMLFIKPSQYLRKRAYDDSKIAPFPFLVGLVVSAAAGVELGAVVYHLGVSWWLPLGVGAVIATYYYLWPALYLAIFQWSFRLASFLWKRTPDGDSSQVNAYGVSPWFVRLILGISRFAAVIACGVLWWQLGAGIHAKLDWDGALLNVISLVVSAVAALAVSIIVGALSFGLLSQGVITVAIASGLALSYWFSPQALALVQAYQLPASTAYGMQALVFFVWTAYLFPLAVLFVSRLFRGFGEWIVRALDYFFNNFFKHFGRFLEAAYDDSDRNYLSFVRHGANIAVATAVGYYAFGFDSIGGASLLASSLRVVLPVLLSYIVGGYLLRLVHNGFIAVVLSGFAAYFVYGLALFMGVPLGAVGAAASAVLTFAVGMIFVFPLAYFVVKMVFNPLLASWLGQPLAKVHEQLSTEIFSSVSHTYEDKAEYGQFFAHATGIAATAAVYFGLSRLVGLLDFAPLYVQIVTISGAVSIYLAAGKLFVRYGNVLIGVLLSLGAGVWGGISVYQHFDANLWYGVGGFFATGLATAFIAFPVSYVVVRALLSLVAVTSWLLPLLAFVHGFFFGFVSRFWHGVVIAYRTIEAAWLPAWRSVSQMWDDSWASAKEMFEETFGKKK
jgi:hypothetical protein